MTRTQCIWRGIAPALVGFSVLLWAAPSPAQRCQPLYTVTTVTDPPVDLGGCSGDVAYLDLSDKDCPHNYGMFTDQLTEFHSNIVVTAPLGATVEQSVAGSYDTAGEDGSHYEFWGYSPEYYGQYQWRDFSFSVGGQSFGGWYGNEFAHTGGTARIMLPAVTETYNTSSSDFLLQTCDITIPRSTHGLFPAGQWALEHLQYDILVTSKWDRIHADNQLSVANDPNDKPYQYRYRVAPHLFPETGNWSTQEIAADPLVLDHIDDGFEATVEALQGTAPDPVEHGYVFQNGHVFDYWRSDDNKVLGTDPSYGWMAPVTFPPAPAVPDEAKSVTAVWKHDVELGIHIVRVGASVGNDLGTVTISSDSVDNSPVTSGADFKVRLTHGYEFTIDAFLPSGWVYGGAGYSERNLDAGDFLDHVFPPGEDPSGDITWLMDKPIVSSFSVPGPAGPGAYYSGGVITVFVVDISLMTSIIEQKLALAKILAACFDITSWLGDPVYPFSGEFCQDAEDLRVKGPGMDFVWSRKYASRNGRDTAQGSRWDYNYNIYVEPLGTDYILYHDGNGRIDTFWYSAKDNMWRAGGRTDTLEWPAGQAPVLRLRDGTIQHFNPFPSTLGAPAGRVSSIVDRNGNEMAFSYNDAGQLASVTDTLGREYLVAHGGVPDRIMGVYENYAGSSRSVTYEYDGDGNLVAVNGPGSGETTQYGYDTAHNLGTVTDTRGNTYLTNHYVETPASGYRVDWQVLGLPSEKITFEYTYWYEYLYTRISEYWYAWYSRLHPTAITTTWDNEYARHYNYTYTILREVWYRLWENTTVTDRNGNVMDMVFWGSILTQKSEGGAVTKYSYNSLGMPTFIQYPNGNRTLYEYTRDDLMNPAKVTRGCGGSTDIAQEFTYLPGLSGCTCGTSFVKTHTDGRSKVTTNDYDTNGNLTSTTHPDGGVDLYDYNNRGQVTEHTWPGGRRDEFGYTDGYMTSITQDASANGGGIRATVLLDRDSRGNVTTMTDANGNVYRFEYDAHDRVTRIESPAVAGGQNVVTIQYDENGNTVNVHAGNTGNGDYQETSYEYEILNCRTKATLSGSSGGIPATPCVTTYAYDGNRNLTSITPGESGTPITFTYNTRNLVTDIRRGDTIISYEYDGNGNITAVTYAGGRHEYTYDSHDQLVAEKDPLDNLAALAYDANGNLVGVDRRDGQGRSLFAASYTYDDVNRLITQAVGAATTQFEYSQASELTKVTNPNGHSVSFGHDMMSRLTSASNDAGDMVTYSYDASGNVLTATQAGSGGMSYTTHCTYDALNRLTSVVDSANHQTGYGYDAQSNVTSVTKANNKRSTFAYDGLNRLLQAVRDIDGLHVTLSQTWDTQSRLASRTDGNGLTTQYDYDALDRVRKVTYADASTRTYTYDDFSNLTGSTSANGASASFTYDALGRMLTRTLTKGALSETANFAYDGLSRLVSASVPGSQVTREYDSLGNLTAEALNGDVVRATYDPAGNMLSQTYPHGRALSFDYDAAERLTRISEGGTALVAYTFEKPHRLAAKHLGNGVETAYSYDNAQNVTGITAAKDRTVLDAWGFTWDSVRNKTGRSDLRDDGVTSTYQYDGLQRLIESVKDAGADPVHYTLDAAGNRTAVTHGPDAGTYVLGAMHQYDSAPAGGLTYDANGNLLTISAGQPNAQEFVYDAQDQLVRHIAHHAGGWQPMSASWTTTSDSSASGSGRIVKAREAGFDALSLTYTADLVSTNAESYGFAAVRIGPDAGGCLAYVGVRIRSANIQLVLYGRSGETILDDAAVMTDAGVAYDLVLNVDRATGTVTLQRAVHGESLAQIASGATGATGLNPDLIVLGAGTATSYAFTNVTTLVGNTAQGELPDRPITTKFQYDPFGRKVRKTVEDGVQPPQITRYAYTGWQVVEEQDNAGTPQASYVYGRYIDEPVQMKRGDATVYYHSDDLYNVTALTDPDGNVVERYRYGDFGAPHIYSPTDTPRAASSVGNPCLFTGRAYDSDLQLYDYRSRHLHPGLGRFTTRDRIGLWGDPVSMGNPYTYAGNAPGMYVDPHGFGGLFGPIAPVSGYTGYEDSPRQMWANVLNRAGLSNGADAVKAALELTPSDKDNVEGLASMLPVLGIPASLDLARKDFANDHYVSAILNCVAVLPFLGGGIKAVGKDIVIADGIARDLKMWAGAGAISDTGELAARGASACDAEAGAAEMAARIDVLKEELKELAQAAAETVGKGKGNVHGIEVHSEFEKLIEDLDRGDLFTEQSYLGGNPARYGKKGSIRADVVFGPIEEPVAIFDLKTGDAVLSPARIAEIQGHLPSGASIPVIEIKP